MPPEDVLLAAAARMEPKIRAAYVKAVEAARSKLPMGRLTDLLEAGDIDAAMAVIRSVVTDLSAEATAPLREALQSMFVATARPAAAEIGLRFNLVNPLAVEYAATQTGVLVGGIGENLPALRQVIARGIREGVGPRVLARSIEPLIGLTGQQSLMTGRYLTGRLGAGVPLERAQALTARFAGKLLRRRATVIARHESATAGVNGQLASWRQGIEEGLIDPSVTVLVWKTGKDERVCPICLPMEGRVTEVVGGSFNTLNDDLLPGVVSSQRKLGFDTVEGPPAHIVCRCGLRRKTFRTVEETRVVLERGSL